jgi:GR25 family glycosyltransferase involved in LPS biosynthesis
MNPFDFFDAIFCINLDSRPDRWDKCLEQFKIFGIEDKVQRFSAIKIVDENNESNKFLGRCGCSLSHFEICKIAKDKSYKNYLVLEDDFEFNFNLETTFDLLNRAILDMPNDWDMFYMGANLTDQYGEFPIENFSKNLFKLKSCHTTHAMAFNSRFYNHFLEKSPDINSIAEWTVNNEIIDVYLSKNFLNKINCFINKEILVNQSAGFSDIEKSSYDYRVWINENFNNFKNIINND